MKKSLWTKQEKDKIQQAYRQGFPVQMIAKTLNRPVRDIYRGLESTKTLEKITPQKNKCLSRLCDLLDLHDDKPLPWHVPLSATLKNVVFWLTQQRFSVLKIDNPDLNDQGFFYQVEKKYFTLPSLLLFANKIRVQQNLPIFHVKGITFEGEKK